MSSATIVVPCYNEAKRLNPDHFKAFIRSGHTCKFVFVNDGSTDRTLDVLVELTRGHKDVFVIVDLPHNVGKGEAVRQGLLAAFETNADYVGYWDADLSTPLDMIPVFCALLDDRPDLEMVMGARVRLLGRTIARNPLRHLLGRVFATAASIVLGMGVYDTQCGAKLFKASPLMISIFQQPFITRWLFDVEIFARLIQSHARTHSPWPEQVTYEFPLYEWCHVDESKVQPLDFFKSFLYLIIIYCTYLLPYRAVLGSNHETKPRTPQRRHAIPILRHFYTSNKAPHTVTKDSDKP